MGAALLDRDAAGPSGHDRPAWGDYDIYAKNVGTYSKPW
ncbi:hypothetical protein MYSE111917_02500 [Mycobacterium senriense]